MGDKLRADLHELFPQAGQRPFLHAVRQCQRPQEVCKIVPERVKLQPHGIGGERVARQPRPLRSVLAFLDPLLGGAAPVALSSVAIAVFGEADPVPESAAATAAVEQSKTNSPKINLPRRGPKRGPDSRAPRARARMSNNEQPAEEYGKKLMACRLHAGQIGLADALSQSDFGKEA